MLRMNDGQARINFDAAKHDSSSSAITVKRIFVQQLVERHAVASHGACLFGSSTRATTASSPLSPRTSFVLCDIPLARRRNVRSFFSGKISCRYNILQYKRNINDDLSCYQLYIVVAAPPRSVAVVPKLLIVR